MELLLILGALFALLNLGSGNAAAEEPPPQLPKSAEEELADAIARIIREHRHIEDDDEEL